MRQLLTLAYRSAGLHWAAHASCCLASASIIVEGEKDGDLPASILLNAGPNERGSIYTMALHNTQWLESAGMREAVAKSDFNVRDIKQKPMTVYIVLPPEYLEAHRAGRNADEPLFAHDADLY